MASGSNGHLSSPRYAGIIRHSHYRDYRGDYTIIILFMTGRFILLKMFSRKLSLTSLRFTYAGLIFRIRAIIDDDILIISN